MAPGALRWNETLLAFRAFVEQVRLVLRDSRRLIRRLITEPDKTATCGNSGQTTNSPTPIMSVPLVILRSTTDREQTELHNLVQSLSTEGYQVAPCGSQWIVYTEIADRRKPVIGESPQDNRQMAVTSERVRRESHRKTPQRRLWDRECSAYAESTGNCMSKHALD